MLRFAKGFTLLEVMIAVVILSLIMMAAGIISSRSYGARERFDLRDEVYHQGFVALDRISRDLEAAFLARALVAALPASPGGEAPAPSPPTAAAAKQPFKSFFIGSDNGDEDAIRFTSLSHVRMEEDAKESDQCRVSYEAEASNKKPGLYDLVRREDAWLDESDEIKGPARVVAEGIKSFNVEYYDERKGDWGKEWNSEAAEWHWKLPQAVRITVAFPHPTVEGEEIALSTAVSLPLQGVIEM